MQVRRNTIRDIERGESPSHLQTARASERNSLTLTRPSLSLKKGLLLTLGAAAAATVVIRGTHGETAAVLKEALDEVGPLPGGLDALVLFPDVPASPEGLGTDPVVIHTESPPQQDGAAALLERTTEALHASGIRKFFVIGRDGFTPHEIPLVNGVLRGLERAPGGVTLHARLNIDADTTNAITNCDIAAAHLNAPVASQGNDSGVAEAVAASRLQIDALCKTLQSPHYDYNGWWPDNEGMRDMDTAIRPGTGASVIVVNPHEAMGAPCAETDWTLATPWNRTQQRAPFESQPSAWAVAMHDGLARARRLGEAALVIRRSDLVAGGVDPVHFASYWRGQQYGVLEVPAGESDRLTVLVGATDLQPVRALAGQQTEVVFSEPAPAGAVTLAACGDTVNVDRSRILASEVAKLFASGVTKVLVGEAHGTTYLTELIARVLQGAMHDWSEPVHFFRELTWPMAQDRMLAAADILYTLRGDRGDDPTVAAQAAGDALLMEVMEQPLEFHAFDFLNNSQTRPLDEFIAKPGRAVGSGGLSHFAGRIVDVNLSEDPWRRTDDPERVSRTKNIVIEAQTEGDERARLVDAQRSMFEGLVRASAVTPTALVVNGDTVPTREDRKALQSYGKALGFRMMWLALADDESGPDGAIVSNQFNVFIVAPLAAKNGIDRA